MLQEAKELDACLVHSSADDYYPRPGSVFMSSSGLKLGALNDCFYFLSLQNNRDTCTVVGQLVVFAFGGDHLDPQLVTAHTSNAIGEQGTGCPLARELYNLVVQSCQDESCPPSSSISSAVSN